MVRRETLSLMGIAAGNGERSYFLGYLTRLSQEAQYSLAEAKQAYDDCLADMGTRRRAKAPLWPEVESHLLTQQAVVDWQERQPGRER